MTSKTLLLSIRPQYAEKIFYGQKSVELRKIRPKIKPGDVVLVYVSSPVKALKGRFMVNRVIEGSPQNLWNEVKGKAGISQEEFEAYFSKSETGFAIFLEKPQLLPKPISLIDLKKLLSNFHPPQSYLYLTTLELNLLPVFH